MHVEKPARVHFIPDLKVWAFVTLRAPIAVKMIVMGTLGKGGLERFLLGSVTDKVVRHSKISVLVVKK